MKKLIALLMAILMATTMMTMAMADGETTEPEQPTTTTSGYTPICPENFETQFTHTLKLNGGLTDIETGYVINYSFAVGDVSVKEPTDIVNVGAAVTGKPSIRAIQYDNTSQFTDGKSVTNLDIDWTGVSIKEPGVYVWPVTKTVDDTDPLQDATNDNEKLYLVFVAFDNGSGVLSGNMYIYKKDAALTNKGNPEESYPSTDVSLSLTKSVEGNQASKHQYFKFTIVVTTPVNSGEKLYDISGVDEKVPVSAYQENEFNNTTAVTLKGGTPVRVEVWLKDGQTALIENMPYGTAYSIIEDPAGYKAGIGVAGAADEDYEIYPDTADPDKKGNTKVEGTLKADNYVTYKNLKEATVPTGIDLQTSAPIFGLLMAMAMMFMAFAGKRKEQMN